MLLMFSVKRQGLFFTITDAFRKILNEFNRKSNKIWVGKESEF